MSPWGWFRRWRGRRRMARSVRRMAEELSERCESRFYRRDGARIRCHYITDHDGPHAGFHADRTLYRWDNLR